MTAVIDQVEQFIIEYIEDNTTEDNISVSGSSNFVNEQLLDSFATLSMIMTLESEYAIKLTPMELADEKMRVVHALAEKVASKIAPQ
ncbi:acyl carrier protein [Litorilituus lipolyticus]|uniref:Acyl carrier protein n=1 Tax=Litorilituus lipolyticus TaxID=2491017 RepID=A0A502KZV1_9GAMM|nr:acyl carrier protein [Litorilituus lipolyticus]TPH17152.1 acyl carrier protein [Litorilituus lipolyticus]